jgi:hypothetical protein
VKSGDFRLGEMTADELAQLKSVSEPPPRCSATRCLQRSAPVKGSTVLITGASFRLRSKGAVNDSIELKGDYNRFMRMKRETFFLEIKLFVDFSSFCE